MIHVYRALHTWAFEYIDLGLVAEEQKDRQERSQSAGAGRSVPIFLA